MLFILLLFCHNIQEHPDKPKAETATPQESKDLKTALDDHERSCAKNNKEIVESLASKLGKPATCQLIVVGAILLGGILAVSSSIYGVRGALSDDISALHERIAKVETKVEIGFENLEGNQMMLSGQIVNLEEKIDELIKQAQLNTDEAARHTLSSE